MINVDMVTKGAMNHDSILSINATDPQSVKNQNNITTVIKPPKYGQPQQSTSYAAQTTPGRPSAAMPRPLVQPAFADAQQTQSVQPAFTSSQQNTGQATAPPAPRPVPALLNKMQKGQKAALSSAPVDIVDACFGWNATDARCDVDVSAFLLGADGKVIGDSWFVFYGQDTSPDQSTQLMPGGAADREKIRIDFKRLDPKVQKIVFVLTINEALANRLHFGMLKDAYMRILDPSGSELVSFFMTEYYTNVISMMIGELYLHNGAWKFNAVGNGVAKDLAGLCELYGVQVSD